jgi:hypothetical protein
MEHNKTSQIRAAILKIWDKLPDDFHGWQVWDKVNRLLPHLDVYQDSILHTMRAMNRKGLINYRCLNRTESHYQKIKP